MLKSTVIIGVLVMFGLSYVSCKQRGNISYEYEVGENTTKQEQPNTQPSQPVNVNVEPHINVNVNANSSGASKSRGSSSENANSVVENNTIPALTATYYHPDNASYNGYKLDYYIRYTKHSYDDHYYNNYGLSPSSDEYAILNVHEDGSRTIELFWKEKLALTITYKDINPLNNSAYVRINYHKKGTMTEWLHLKVYEDYTNEVYSVHIKDIKEGFLWSDGMYGNAVSIKLNVDRS